MNMDNFDLDEMKYDGSPMKHGGGNIDFNSPSDGERSMLETMPQTNTMPNVSPFGKKNSVQPIIRSSDLKMYPTAMGVRSGEMIP